MWEVVEGSAGAIFVLCLEVVGERGHQVKPGAKYGDGSVTWECRRDASGTWGCRRDAGVTGGSLGMRILRIVFLLFCRMLLLL